MRIVVALGGNAFLKRGEPMTHVVQRANIQVAARALAPVAVKQRVLTGIEAVIDKDLVSELLACEVEVDLLVIATNFDGNNLTGGKGISAGWEK